MPITFSPIAKTVLTGTQSTVTFSSIPQTYTDLKMLIYARGNGAGESNVVQFTINGSTPTVTYARILQNGPSVAGQRGSGQFACFIAGSNTASAVYGSVELNIPRYTNTSYNKIYSLMSYQPSDTNTANTINACFGDHFPQSTSAISSIDVTVSGASFVSGSLFYLYGIKNS